jgi:RNA polymerase sigma-70 factor (ECF subfamily)
LSAAVRTLDAIFRAESGPVLATLIRVLGDFQLAEDALQDAVTAALEVWPKEGLPAAAGGGVSTPPPPHARG